MNYLIILKIAFTNILKNKVRSFLTSLGIIIGISSVIIMVGIGEGTQDKIKKEIEALGTNLIMVRPSFSRYGGISRGAGSFVRLTLKDVENIKKKSEYTKYISPFVSVNRQVIFDNKNWNTSIQGVGDEYFNIRNIKVSYGYLFDNEEVESNKNYALLGETVKSQLFGSASPLGKMIRIANIPFKVIGVLEAKGKANDVDQDDLVIIPYTTALNKLIGGKYIRMIYIGVNSSENISLAEEEIGYILRESHRLKDGDNDDFTISTQSELVQRSASITGMMTLLLASIAAVSLIVGGIGVMNIMLVSVTERTREIGIRMAVGARKKDILFQFLIEAIVLSALGGTFGILFSFVVSFILNTFTQITLIINLKMILIAVIFTTLVGIFFGFYPAKKASELNPIEALRYE